MSLRGWLLGWLGIPEIQAQIEKLKPVPVLIPGECECGHSRCCHTDGIGKCNCAVDYETEDGKYKPREEWGACACRVYIFDDDDDDDEGEDDPTPTPEELERLFKR